MKERERKLCERGKKRSLIILSLGLLIIPVGVQSQETNVNSASADASVALDQSDNSQSIGCFSYCDS